MRRYLPVFFLAFFLIVVLTALSYFPGAAGQNKGQSKNLTVYTNITLDPLTVLAQVYEKSSGVRLSLVVLPEQELLARLADEKEAPKADLILATADVLHKAKAAGLLAAYSSEQVEVIPARFRDKDFFWVGAWYDPIVLAANQDYLKKSAAPKEWNDLYKDNKMKIVLTDFLAADAAANLLYDFAVHRGENQALEFFQKIHLQVVQYTKFLATPVRMTGMGEADVAVAFHSEALRYANDGFPIRILHPEDGTTYAIVGAGLSTKPSQDGEAKKFIEWLLQDQAYSSLREHKFYFIPTNPETTVYKEYRPQEIKLFPAGRSLSDNDRKRIFDKWVQTVRMVSK